MDHVTDDGYKKISVINYSLKCIKLLKKNTLYFTILQFFRDERFPDSLGASAKKVNDAMHRFKKCITQIQFSICIVSNKFAPVKTDFFLLVDALHFCFV